MVALVISLGLVGGGLALAEESPAILSDEQIGQIRTKCVSGQSNLQRIDEAGTLARYNLAQQYNIMSSKLMAPMNSRIAINRLDGVATTQTSTEFNRQIDLFKASYQTYEDTLQKAIKMDCKDRPSDFFDTVNLARQQRAVVRSTIDEMNTLIKRYEQQVNQLRVDTTSTKSKGSVK